MLILIFCVINANFVFVFILLGQKSFTKNLDLAFELYLLKNALMITLTYGALVPY